MSEHKVYLNKDEIVPADLRKRKFNKKDEVTCSREVSLYNQKIDTNDIFIFDSYDNESGFCFIKVKNRVMFHHCVNESDLTKYVKPKKKK